MITKRRYVEPNTMLGANQGYGKRRDDQENLLSFSHFFIEQMMAHNDIGHIHERETHHRTEETVGNEIITFHECKILSIRNNNDIAKCDDEQDQNF